MAAHNKVIWYEGMAIEPQHFEQQTRYFESIVNFKVSLLEKQLWGFAELSLDTDLLSIGKLGLESASGVFPDGTAFSMPNTDVSPIPYSVPEGLTNTLLYLALPVKHAGVADAGDEHSQQTYRYQTIHKVIADDIADSGEETDVSVGTLSCRILTEHDDRDGYMCLPMVKIKEVRANNQIKFDKTFIPAWLDMHQAAPLEKFLEEVVTMLTNRAEMLSNRLSDTQQAGTADMVDLILLQLSNKYEVVFRELQQLSPLHPRHLYTEMLTMLAEMSTYTTDRRRPAITAVQYMHENLFETFKPVILASRKALSMVLEQNATTIELEQQGHGLWMGQIPDQNMFVSCNFVLAVYADLPMETVRTNFPTQIKISPAEKIQILVSKSLPGIAIQPIAVAPRQIAYHPNFSYFAIDAQGDLWSELSHSGHIAMHVPGNIPGVKLELYAIKG